MFDDFIGNKKAVNLISIGIKAAQRKSDKFPDYIFSGAAGNGKSKMANDIVKGTDSTGVFLNAATISNTNTVVDAIDNGIKEYNRLKKRRIIMVVDEAHSLKGNKICDFFLTAISENKIEIKNGSCVENFPIMRVKTQRNDFLSWIFITNRAGELADALISRLTEVRFIDYSFEEKEKIAKTLLDKALDVEFEESVCAEIAKRSWSAREVVKYTNGIYDYCISTYTEEVVTLKSANEYFKLIGVDERGLGEAEMNYIDILASSKGSISLQNIAAKMGIGVKDVSEMIEKKLVRLGIVNIESNGRSLSDRSDMKNRFSV